MLNGRQRDKSEGNELLFYPGGWSFPAFAYEDSARKIISFPSLNLCYDGHGQTKEASGISSGK